MDLLEVFWSESTHQTPPPTHPPTPLHSLSGRALILINGLQGTSGVDELRVVLLPAVLWSQRTRFLTDGLKGDYSGSLLEAVVSVYSSARRDCMMER